MSDNTRLAADSAQREHRVTADSADLDHRLAADSAQLEQLLAELRDLVPLPVWQRVEDVLRRVVGLYGAGLSRAIAHARDAGVDAPTFGAKLAGDELVASLLVLHGLHPQSTEQRVEGAIRALTAELGIADDALTLVEIRDGVVHLHARGSLGAGAMSPGLAESVVRRVIETAAPEIRSLEISGLPAPRDPSLVQLRTSRPTP